MQKKKGHSHNESVSATAQSTVQYCIFVEAPHSNPNSESNWKHQPSHLFLIKTQKACHRRNWLSGLKTGLNLTLLDVHVALHGCMLSKVFFFCSFPSWTNKQTKLHDKRYKSIWPSGSNTWQQVWRCLLYSWAQVTAQPPTTQWITQINQKITAQHTVAPSIQSPTLFEREEFSLIKLCSFLPEVVFKFFFCLLNKLLWTVQKCFM